MRRRFGVGSLDLRIIFLDEDEHFLYGYHNGCVDSSLKDRNYFGDPVKGVE